MPAKKPASKKRTKAAATRKKVAAKKAASKKKVAKKRKVTRKKVAARKKKSSKKRPVARKKVAKKKVSKKKAPARKKVSKKKAPARKKVSKKKAAGRKKASKKKAAVRKKASKKRPSSKKNAVSRTRPPARKTSVRRIRSRGDVLSGPIHGISAYKPRRGEEYMSAGQLQHFGKILDAWKRELMFEVDRTVHHMQDEAANFPDPNDRATQESEFGLELRTRDRERKLLRKIDSALMRVEDRSYGFCNETGEEIGMKRLEARPVATLCLEAQERRELAERQFRDRDDRYR